MNRNVDDHFNKTPTPHFPRSRFDMGIHKRLQTQGHGRLYPFFGRIVYPGDTWQMDATTFVRTDTSLRVPLDDIYLDTYWFFVPFRIIDQNFPKILGEGEPEDYDDVSYGFPTFTITTECGYTINNLLDYLGYKQSAALVDALIPGAAKYSYVASDEICPYLLMAYYKIWNDWFRDENLDASIPYGDLSSGTDLYIFPDLTRPFDNGDCLKVNKYHDYFTSGSIAPQKGPAQTIPLGTTAPVGIFGVTADAGSNNNIVPSDFSASEAKFVQTKAGATNSLTGMYANLADAAGTINELRLAFAIQALYERRGRFGTRYIETIRGQWGIEVPDSFFLRPEYLGGNRVTLNNVPVLSTENSSQLGQMSGNSSTLSNGGSWTKTFVEYGVIIGVSCTRVKHSYGQGLRKEVFDLETQLSLYNPVFANIGLQPVMRREIYNVGLDANGDKDDTVFCYQEAWADLRSDIDTFAGGFGNFSTNTELKNKWHYGDYYSSAPSFNATWLKEDYTNVARTLTGNLIAGAGSTETEGHQFMFGYYYHPIVTRILSSRSIPVELIGHL